MFPTRNDLPENVREEVISLLNQSLADISTLKSYAKQAHWSLKGPQFFSVHLLFDDIAEELEAFADDIAERAMALGGQVAGTVQDASAKTILPPYPTAVAVMDHIRQMSDAMALFGRLSRSAIDRCLSFKDNGTADLYTEISRQIDKRLWFLEAHLQG